MPRLSLLLVLAFLVIIPAARADYPAAQNNYVNDFAGVITPSDSTRLRDQLAALERDTGIEGTVVTIRSIAQYSTGAPNIEQFATRLFNRWRVGNQPKNNGFMVLVSINDRRCRIELGKGWPRSLDPQMRAIINQQMIPHFKSGDFNGGIVDAVAATISTLRTQNAKPVLAEQPPRPAKIPAEAPLQNQVQHQLVPPPFHPPTHAPSNMPHYPMQARPIEFHHRPSVHFPVIIFPGLLILAFIVLLLKSATSPSRPHRGFMDDDTSSSGSFMDSSSSSSFGSSSSFDSSSSSSSSGSDFGGGSSSGGGASGGW